MESNEEATERAETRAAAALGRPHAVSDEEAYAIHREETRTNYFLAGVLFVGGGFGAIIPDALHQPTQPATVYLLPTLAVVSGLIVLALASRLPRRYLHVVAIVAALEIALTVALADQIFSTYFTFVAIFAAYVFTSRRAIAAHIGFVALLCFAPLIYSPDDARDILLQGSILVPTLFLAGGAVAYLRERLESSEARYRTLSELDPLTGVGNYRMLSLRVPRELRRHTRSAKPLSLLVFDLDGFKRVNDEFGHQRGDAVLQSVAQALSDGVRDHDIVVRQGGDEFAVVAPETDEEAATALAGRLCSAISRISPEGVRIGASMGSAIFPEDADSLERLLAVADARLREDKLDSLISYRRSSGSERESKREEAV
jgi:diguanylate cyclase (GGDEF)-like protein